MLISTVFFGLMAVTIRYASRTLPTFEIAFFRNAFGLLALLPLLLHSGASLRTKQLPRYLLRSAIGICSMLSGFWAIGHLPLSQAISLSYSTPLFVTILAVFWLGEHVRKRRWAAVIVGRAERDRRHPDQAALARRSGRYDRLLHLRFLGPAVAGPSPVRVAMAARHGMGLAAPDRRLRHRRTAAVDPRPAPG
jgi:uncharacterized membrane protein